MSNYDSPRETRDAFFVISPDGSTEAGFDTKEKADAFMRKKSDEVHGWPNYPQNPVPGYSIKLVKVNANPSDRY